MASFVVIVEPRGHTQPMLQANAFEYLCAIVGCRDGDPERPNLSQALNDVFSNPRPAGTEGKFNGRDFLYNGNQTRHASAGVPGGTSVTLFFYVLRGTAYIFAVGEHVGQSSYRISHFGQPVGAFRMNALIDVAEKKAGKKPGKKR